MMTARVPNPSNGRPQKELRAMVLSPAEWMQVVKMLRLTPQQARIVELILRGARDRQIAEVLDLGAPTIRTHLRAIFRKLAIGDRVELVLLVFATARGVEGRGHPL